VFVSLNWSQAEGGSRRQQHMNFVSLRNELSHVMVELQELTAMLTTAGGYDAVRTIQTLILSASDVTTQVTKIISIP